eukprot:Selendium_serpulae@DN3332_c0_g1_i5.p1
MAARGNPPRGQTDDVTGRDDVTKPIPKAPRARKGCDMSFAGSPLEQMRKDYHIMEFLGSGQFGSVYKGRRKGSTDLLALKFISKLGKNERDVANLRGEIAILRGLDHDNINRMIDSVEFTSAFCVVLEFCRGEVYRCFAEDSTLGVDIVQKVCNIVVLTINHHDGTN